MVPTFIHIMANGDVWHSIDTNFTPAGTVLATYRVASLASNQKLGTLSGNNEPKGSTNANTQTQ